MEYVDRTFLDEVVYLDGNEFRRCTFDGCVLKYEGGSTAFLDHTRFRGEVSVEFGSEAERDTNPITAWLLTNIVKQGGRVSRGDEVASDRQRPKHDKPG